MGRSGPIRRLEWAEGLDVPLMSEQGGREVEYLLWVGCAGATDPRARKTNQALVRILKAAGVDFATLGTEERCTGDPARRLGNEYVFAELAKAERRDAQAHRFRKVLVTCPHCLNSLGKDYREHGGSTRSSTTRSCSRSCWPPGACRSTSRRAGRRSS